MSFLGRLSPPVLAALALLLAQPSPAPAQKVSAAKLIAKADSIAKTVSKLRGLSLKSKVRSGVMNKAQIKARILKILHEEYTDAELAAESLALKRFGLIPEKSDYVAIMVKLLQDQIAGFYDPGEKKLFIAGWQSTDGDMLMAHEIDHALQDQHFDLENFMKADKRNGDAMAARQALVEGDGMAIMLEFKLAETKQAPPWGNPFVLAMIKQALTQGLADMGDVPLAMQEGLVFPYVAGLEFVANIRKDNPWSKVDAIYAKPPLSTEQVLHPEKYRTYEKPDEVSARRPALLKDYTERVSSVLGEKGIELFLRTHGVSESRAVVAAAGWGGDRYAVYAKSGHTGSALRNTVGVSLTSWDEESDAIEFFESLEHALPTLAKGAKTKRKDKGLQFAIGKRGQVVAERRGEQVLFLVDVPTAAVDSLRKEVWNTWAVAAPAAAP